MGSGPIKTTVSRDIFTLFWGACGERGGRGKRMGSGCEKKLEGDEEVSGERRGERLQPIIEGTAWGVRGRARGGLADGKRLGPKKKCLQDAGARNLLHLNRATTKVKKKKIYDWLSNQDTYTLHHPIKKRFLRLSYNVSNFDEVWECDLLQLTSIKDYNDGYCYILVVIDGLEKFAWVEPLQDKTTRIVADAFERIIDRRQSLSGSTGHCASEFGDIFPTKTPNDISTFYKKSCTRTIILYTVVRGCALLMLTSTMPREHEKTCPNAHAPIIGGATCRHMVKSMWVISCASVVQKTPSSEDMRKISARKFLR